MTKNKNAVNALISEYEKAILELKYVIREVSNEDLAHVVDTETKNTDCKSIQTILAHVVRSGYSYCVYIRNSRNDNAVRPKRIKRKTVSEYHTDLDNVLKFTNDTFAEISDGDLERFTDAEKMKTSWKQLYDIEQIMEHAIVHILRHRRQIEHFKVRLNQM